MKSDIAANEWNGALFEVSWARNKKLIFSFMCES
jgi:hypothetical protein